MKKHPHEDTVPVRMTDEIGGFLYVDRADYEAMQARSRTKPADGSLSRTKFKNPATAALVADAFAAQDAAFAALGRTIPAPAGRVHRPHRRPLHPSSLPVWRSRP